MIDLYLMYCLKVNNAIPFVLSLLTTLQWKVILMTKIKMSRSQTKDSCLLLNITLPCIVWQAYMRSIIFVDSSGLLYWSQNASPNYSLSTCQIQFSLLNICWKKIINMKKQSPSLCQTHADVNVTYTMEIASQRDDIQKRHDTQMLNEQRMHWYSIKVLFHLQAIIYQPV